MSDGGVTKVALGALTVTAPAGAIAEGQTLEVRRGRPPGVPDHGLTSLIGGAIDVTTSQGQPSAPVALRVAVPATALSDGSEPLLLHGDGQVVRWLPEPSTFSADTLIATVSSFSPIDIVDSVTYAGGLLTGDRTDLPSDCQPDLPSWIDAETLPHTDKNGALPLCLADGTNEQQAKVRLVNNRGYAQTVRVTGATFAISGSGFQQSLEQQIAEAYARRASPSDPQRFVIAPGGSVVLTFPRPEETPTAQLVRFSVESQQWTGLAAIAWSIATTAKDEIGLPVAAVDCLIGGLYNVASTDAGLDSGLGQLRACGDVAVGFADQAKRKVWKRLTTGLAVNSVAFKYLDSQADAVYPPEMTFTIGGSGEVDSGVVISPNDLGTVENAKTTTVQLTATGADEPYVFRLRAIGGSWPDWVTLEPSGLLTITPPAGTSGQYTLYAYTRQPNGRHSAYALNPITFSIAAPPAPPRAVKELGENCRPNGRARTSSNGKVIVLQCDQYTTDQVQFSSSVYKAFNVRFEGDPLNGRQSITADGSLALARDSRSAVPGIFNTRTLAFSTLPSELTVPIGGTGLRGADSAAISPDGRLVATKVSRNVIKLWDRQSNAIRDITLPTSSDFRLVGDGQSVIIQSDGNDCPTCSRPLLRWNGSETGLQPIAISLPGGVTCDASDFGQPQSPTLYANTLFLADGSFYANLDCRAGQSRVRRTARIVTSTFAAQQIDAVDCRGTEVRWPTLPGGSLSGEYRIDNCGGTWGVSRFGVVSTFRPLRPFKDMFSSTTNVDTRDDVVVDDGSAIIRRGDSRHLMHFVDPSG